MALIHRPGGLVFRDLRGFTSSVHWTQALDSAALPAAIVAAQALTDAIEGLTHATLISTSGIASEGVIIGGYGAVGIYSSVADRVRFTWRTNSGGLARHTVPAPKQAIFYGGGSTVNPANALVIAYRLAMLGAVATTGSGDPLAELVAGKLYIRSAHRRIGTLVLEPGLTGSDY